MIIGTVRLMAATDFMLSSELVTVLLVVVPLVVIGLSLLARRSSGPISHSELRKRMKCLQQFPDSRPARFRVFLTDSHIIRAVC